MNRFTLKLWGILTLLALLITSADATIVSFNLAEFMTNPTTNRQVVLQPTTPFAGDLVYLPVSDVNGLTGITNIGVGLWNGWISAPPSKISFQIYVTATNLGTVDAFTILTTGTAATYPAGQTAWAISASDVRYQLSGTTLSNTFYPLYSNPSNYANLITVTGIINSISGANVGVGQGTNVTIITNGNSFQVSANPQTNGFTSIVNSNPATSFELLGAAATAAKNATNAGNIVFSPQLPAITNLFAHTNDSWWDINGLALNATNGIGISSGLSAFWSTNTWDTNGAALLAFINSSNYFNTATNQTYGNGTNSQVSGTAVGGNGSIFRAGSGGSGSGAAGPGGTGGTSILGGGGNASGVGIGGSGGTVYIAMPGTGLLNGGNGSVIVGNLSVNTNGSFYGNLANGTNLPLTGLQFGTLSSNIWAQLLTNTALVQVTNAANTSATAQGVLNTNFSLLLGAQATNYGNIIGSQGTNFGNVIGNAGTNYANGIGTGATNYANGIGTAATNESLLIGNQGTNFSLAQHLILTNNINTNGINSTNFINLIGSNGTNFTLLIALTLSNNISTNAIQSTNEVLLIGLNGTNAFGAISNTAMSAATNILTTYSNNVTTVFLGKTNGTANSLTLTGSLTNGTATQFGFTTNYIKVSGEGWGMYQWIASGVWTNEMNNLWAISLSGATALLQSNNVTIWTSTAGPQTNVWTVASSTAITPVSWYSWNEQSGHHINWTDDTNLTAQFRTIISSSNAPYVLTNDSRTVSLAAGFVNYATNTGNTATSTVAIYIAGSTYNKWTFTNCGHGGWISNAVSSVGLTNLFSALSPFSAGDVGKVIDFKDAGTNDIASVPTNYPYATTTVLYTNHFDWVGTITAFLNPSNVTISTGAGNTTTNGVFWGLDESAAIQADYTFICTNAGNNEWSVLDGVYMIATNIWDEGPWTNHYCAQIFTPSIMDGSPNGFNGITKHATIKGQHTAQGSLWNTTTLKPRGAVFVSTLYGKNTNLYSVFETRDMSGATPFQNEPAYYVPIYPNALGVALAGVNYNRLALDVENIAFVMPYDNNSVVLSLAGCAGGATVSHSAFIGSWNQVAPQNGAMSGTNGWAILFPGSMNDNSVDLDWTDIIHFYNAVGSGGNIQSFGRVLISQCWNAIVGISTADQDCYSGLSLQADKNYFVGNFSTLNVQANCAPQDSEAPAWWNFPNMCVQTNNGGILADIVVSLSSMQLNYMTNGGIPNLVTTPTSVNVRYVPSSPNGAEGYYQNRQSAIGGFYSYDAANKTPKTAFYISEATSGGAAYGRIGFMNAGSLNDLVLAYNNTKTWYWPYQAISGGYQGGEDYVGFLAGVNTTKFIATNSLTINSNAWSLTSVTNGMANFSSIFASSNGAPVIVYSSNGLAYVYFLTAPAGGIIP